MHQVIDEHLGDFRRNSPADDFLTRHSVDKFPLDFDVCLPKTKVDMNLLLEVTRGESVLTEG